MRPRNEVFQALAKSPFRQKFRLNAKEHAYLGDRGLDAILDHGRAFISERLAPALPPNDGKQTPMRGHPVFVAQHATATCCRGCLSKWHGIPAGRALSAEEQANVLGVISAWIEAEVTKPAGRDVSLPQRDRSKPVQGRLL